MLTSCPLPVELVYEFRRHFMFETTAGYNQTISQWGAVESNQITFVASVNYLFY